MKGYSVILLVVGLLALQNAMSGNWQVIPSLNGTHKANEMHGISALSENDAWDGGFATTPDGGAAIMNWGWCFLGGDPESAGRYLSE